MQSHMCAYLVIYEEVVSHRMTFHPTPSKFSLLFSQCTLNLLCSFVYVKPQKMEEFICAEVQPDHHADGVRLLHHGDPGRVRAGTQQSWPF